MRPEIFGRPQGNCFFARYVKFEIQGVFAHIVPLRLNNHYAKGKISRTVKD